MDPDAWRKSPQRQVHGSDIPSNCAPCGPADGGHKGKESFAVTLFPGGAGAQEHPNNLMHASSSGGDKVLLGGMTPTPARRDVDVGLLIEDPRPSSSSTSTSGTSRLEASRGSHLRQGAGGDSQGQRGPTPSGAIAFLEDAAGLSHQDAHQTAASMGDMAKKAGST